MTLPSKAGRSSSGVLVIGRVAAAQGRGHLVALPVGARDQLGRDRDERRGRGRRACAPDWCRSRRSPRAAASTRNAPARTPSGANGSSSAAVRRRSSVVGGGRQARAVHGSGDAAGRRAVWNAQQRTARRRGGCAGAVTATGRAVAASAEPVVPVERTDVPAAVERSKIAVGLVPGAVSESGGGRPDAVGAGTPAGARRADWTRCCGECWSRRNRCCSRRSPAGLPKRGSSLDSGLSKFGSAPARGSVRRTRRPAPARAGRIVACVLQGGAQTAAPGASPAARAHASREHGQDRAEPAPERLKPQHAARATSSRPRKARLMVNGCKTRMVNAALRRPVRGRLARAFPC